MVDGHETLAIHERADAECFEVVDHIRRIHKRVRTNEKVRFAFEQLQKSRGRAKPLVASQDSEAKWIGLTVFLQRHWELRQDLQELSLRHPEMFRDIGGVLSANRLIISRDIQGLMKPWEHATSIMQSNKPQFWSASAYLPTLKTLKATMDPSNDISVLGTGQNPKHKDVLTHDQLCEPAKRIRKALQEEIDINYRHVTACEELLRLCTCCDPRWRLSMWESEEFADLKALLRDKLVDDTMRFHDALRASLQPVADAPKKKTRIFKPEGSFGEFERAMAKITALTTNAPESRATFKARVEKQWRDYFDGELVPLQTDPYEWWRSQDESKLGLLFPTARKYLGVPASNANIERFFSICKHLFAHLRSAMAEETVEKWLQLSMNMEVLGMFTPVQAAGDESEEEEIARLVAMASSSSAKLE